MTTQHAGVICFALGVATVCSMRNECHAMLPQLLGLCGTVIGGVLGNAMMEGKKKKIVNKGKDESK